MMRLTRSIGLAAGFAAVAACAVGPNYHRPKLDAAPNYKEAGDWKPSEPNDVLNRGPWWEIFKDDALNQLELRVDISNETVKAAAAAYDQARALVAQARAGYWPTVGVNAGKVRGSTDGGPTRTLDSAGVSAGWDLDIWG
ncbi:MAG: TolC family protein, partial [Steroidobacteraceae bacterium]